MGGFEKFEPAIFNEGDVAPSKLDLEKVAVMSGAEQHGLPFERDARLPVLIAARLLMLGLLEAGQHRLVRPAAVAELSPGIVIERISAADLDAMMNH